MAEFDRFSDRYEQILDQSVSLSGEDSHYFAEYKAGYLARLVGKNFAGKFLDFGCGVGLLGNYLMRYVPVATIHGYDISEASIERINDELKARGRFTHNFFDLDGDYDIIVIANVMHHIPPDERQETINKVRECLAPAGRLVVFEHNPANPLTRWVVERCAFDKDAILLTPRETEKYMLQTGLLPKRRDFIVFFPKILASLRSFEPLLAWCPLGAQYTVVGENRG